MHYLSVNEPAIVTKLIAILHKGSGEVLKKKPRSGCEYTYNNYFIQARQLMCFVLLFNGLGVL